MPYNNAAYKQGNLPGQKDIPAVTGRGSEGDHLWATYETGVGKAGVIEAFLLYTVNGGKILCSHGSHEEWFRAPAKLTSGRVEGAAPPGMTHGVFCLIDENSFLVHSEPVPLISEHGSDKAMSVVLEDGYAYRPGLISLINTRASAQENAQKKGLKTTMLSRAIEAARAIAETPVDGQTYAVAMRNLCHEIRVLDVPEAKLSVLNLFATTKSSSHDREIRSNHERWDHPVNHPRLFSGETVNYAFHSDSEENPWAKIDLGSVKTINLIEIVNRPNEGTSAGLIVSRSSDGKKWEQVWRAVAVETTWQVPLTPGIDVPGREARFIKLKTRNDRPSPLLLQRLRVYGSQ